MHAHIGCGHAQHAHRLGRCPVLSETDGNRVDSRGARETGCLPNDVDHRAIFVCELRVHGAIEQREAAPSSGISAREFGQRIEVIDFSSALDALHTGSSGANTGNVEVPAATVEIDGATSPCSGSVVGSPRAMECDGGGWRSGGRTGVLRLLRGASNSEQECHTGTGGVKRIFHIGVLVSSFSGSPTMGHP